MNQQVSEDVVLELVQKALGAYEAATNDTERFASLLIIGKVMSSGARLPLIEQRQIFQVIGFDMIYRLLNTKDVPSDCPKTIYASVGCSLLACFSCEPGVISDAQMHTLAPILVKFLSESDDEALLMDTLDCILSYLTKESSHELLLSCNCLEKLCMIYLNNDSLKEKACEILCQFSIAEGPKIWKDIVLFNDVMKKLSDEFVSDQTSKKFLLCENASKLLLSCPQYDFDKASWCNNLERGLGDILFSKIEKDQRDPALKLTSRLVILKDLPLLLSSQNSSSKFYHLVTRLACIEIIMVLEDHNLMEIISDAELLVACFSIVERAFGYLKPSSTVSSKQKEQLYKTFKATIAKVLVFLKDVWSLDKDSLQNNQLCCQIITGCVRIVGAWTTQEPFSLRDEVFDCIDALLDLCDLCKDNCYPLKFLLPTLSYLVSEDNFLQCLERNILIQLNSSFQSQIRLLEAPQCESEEIEAVDCVVAIASVLINILVIHENGVAGNVVLNDLIRYLFSEFPLIRDTVHGYAVLSGNLTALGLLLMKTQTLEVKKIDILSCRFLQNALRFLWDAFSIEENKLSVSELYLPVWKEVMELWFLSIETLKSNVPKHPWITIFVMESGWLDEILGLFKNTQKDGIESNIKSAFEDLLCCLAQSNTDCFDYLKSNNMLELCYKFELNDLPNCLLQHD